MGDLVWAVLLVAIAHLPLVLFTSDRLIVHVWESHQETWRAAGAPTCYFSRGIATPGDPSRKGPRETAVRSWIWRTPDALRGCAECRRLRVLSRAVRVLMFFFFVAGGSLAVYVHAPV